MINESSVLKELFLDLEGNKVSEKKDADYTKIETLMGSCGKEKLAQALEGLNVLDALIRDMTGESAKIVMHSLSVFCSVFEVKPEVVKRPEALLRGLVSIVQSNLSLAKASNVVAKALKCICMICPLLKTLGKDTSAIKNILLHFMLDSENNSASDVKIQALTLFKSLVVHKLLEFTDTSNWLKLLVNLIFDDSPSVREAALQAADVFKLRLTGNEEYLDVLANALVPSKFSKLMIEMILTDKNWAVIWRLFVEILGRRLHTSSSLVNSLLAVEEKAFKTSNVETKKEAFNCWNSLLFNFALEQSVLSSDRRVKLLTIPLRANNCRNGDVALVKLNVWWNIIRLMKSDVTNYSEMILTPFLCFCYGGINESSGNNGPGRLNSSNTGEACAKLYPVLRVPSLHALCEILSKSAKLPLPAALAKDLAIEPLVDPPVVSQKVFCSQSRLLTHCLGEAVNLEGYDAQLVPYVVQCWNSLLTLVAMGGDEPLYVGDTVSKDLKNIAMVKELLRLVANLVEATALCDGKTTAIIVSMIESMVTGECALPPVILNSHALGVGNVMVMNSFPTLLLSTLMLSPTFAVEKKLHPRIKDVFSRLIKIGFSNILSPLPFVRALLKRMDKDISEQSPSVTTPFYQELWVLIANHLSDVIDKDGSVSEGNGAGHDFHCMYGMLMLPIIYALRIDMPQESLAPALKAWGRLFDLFVVNAQLVVTAQSYEIVEELCRKILGLYKKSATKSWPCSANGIQYIWIMYQKPYFDTVWKGYAKKQVKEDMPVGLPFSQQLLVLLTSKMVTGLTSSESIDCKDDSSRHKMVMNFFVLIFSTQSLTTVNVILEKGIQCMSFFLNKTADLKKYQHLKNEMISLWEKFLMFLEKTLPSCASKPQTVVESLSPLLTEAFKHPLNQVVEQAKLSWNGYLGEYFSSAHIPKSLSAVLDDALKDTTGSEDVLEGMASSDSPKSVFAIPERSRGKAKQKAVAPVKAKESVANSRSTEDNVEFKVIPPKIKASVLTDHQREMMKERRVDIPALYQDLTQDSVSQSFSQESQALPVMKTSVSAVVEEDANSSFAQNLQSEANVDAVEKVAEVDKVLTFTLPISDVSTSAKKISSPPSSSATAPNPEEKVVQSDVQNGDLKSQEASGNRMNDLSKGSPAVRGGRRGRKRKQPPWLKNSNLPPDVAKTLSDEKVKGTEAPITSSDIEKTTDGDLDLNVKPSPGNVTDGGIVVSEQPNLPSKGGDLVPETCASKKDVVESVPSVNGVSKDAVTADSAPKTSTKCLNIVIALDSSRSTPKISTADPSNESVSESDLQTETDVDMASLEDKSPGSSVVAKEVSETSSKCADEAASKSKKEEVGLAYLKISSPRKISEIEFSTLQAKELDSSMLAAGPRDSPCITLGSPNCKAPARGRASPVSPKAKSAGNSPSLDKWVIVTKRESEDKSPAKSPLKPATVDGGSKNIPVVVLDSDSDVSDTVENRETHEIYVFSNSEDLVDSSQDPLDSPSISLKGPVKKCSINLSRVSDILPQEVAFIQYEGRTVKCHMSPRKEEGKADEEAKKVTPVCSPLVSNKFSPRNSRGARILNLAQGNKEKSGADENPESPVRDAANKVALQTSDNNLQHSPISHLKSFDVNNSTPPNKKPRRIRPMHIGNVSPQYKSLEIGCVASEGEVTVHSYSPNASPGGSVMKRKKPAGEDSISPLSKKARRVSFADPIVTRQVEFCVPDSERDFKKRNVHRCLKLPGSSPNAYQPGIPNIDSDLEVVTRIKRTCTLQSSPSTRTEDDDNRENAEVTILSQCEQKTTESEEVQAVVQSDADLVEVLSVETSIPKADGGNEVNVILAHDKDPEVESHPLPAEQSVTLSTPMEQSLAGDSEPSEMEVDVNIDPPLLPAAEKSHDYGKESPLSSSQNTVKDKGKLLESINISENESVTAQTSASKEDSSTDISDNSEKAVSSPDVGTGGELIPDSISSSHQSLESPKTSDSSEISLLESEGLEEPQTDKLNSQEEAFPALRDCQDPLVLIIEKLTTKLWKERCRQALEKRGIVTIGELSRTTEEMVDKIPIKAPKWKNLRAELQEYHSKLTNTDERCETPESGGHDQSDSVEVVVGVDSNLQNFRKMLSSMSAKDILKELRACNLAEAVLLEMDTESPVSQNAPHARKQARNEKLSKMTTSPPKTFESISVQVSEFEVLSELQLMMKKKKNPVNEDASSVSTQVSYGDLTSARNEVNETQETEQPEASKIFQSTSTQYTLSETEVLADKPVQVPKLSTSIAVQVSDGDILSRMDSYEVLNLLHGRSDFKDAIGGLSPERLMHLLKLVVRSAHGKGQWFDGSVDLIAKSIIQCVVKEMMKDNQTVDSTKVIMWILQKTLFSKEYVKIIPAILSGVNESVVSELILSQENIMNSLQAQLPAARGLKLAVDVLEQRNITLLPEEEIDRLNDIIDSHRTCGELFDRYTRVVRDRIMGNNISH